MRREIVLNDPLARPASVRVENGRQDSLQLEKENSRRMSQSVQSMDPVDFIVSEILGNGRTLPITNFDGRPSLESLRAMRRYGQWNLILASSRDILPQMLSQEELHEVYGLRFEALYKLQQLNDLQLEIDSVLNSMQNASESSSSSNFLISLVLLSYEVQLVSGKDSEAFRTLDILMVKLQMRKDSQSKFWYWQLKSHLCNGLLRSKNWKSALQLLQKLLVEVSDEINLEYDTGVAAAKIVLLFRAAKLMLQIGSISLARKYYEQCSEILLSDHDLASDAYLQSLSLSIQGLIQFSEEKFEEAMDTFTTLMEAEKLRLNNNPSQLLSKNAITFVVLEQLDESLLSSAVNNFAICSLYVKNNIQSIQRLEKLIGEDPQKYMTDPVVFNLCTMYDLSYAPDVSNQRKRALQKIALKYGLEDPILHWRSFRLA